MENVYRPAGFRVPHPAPTQKQVEMLSSGLNKVLPARGVASQPGVFYIWRTRVGPPAPPSSPRSHYSRKYRVWRVPTGCVLPAHPALACKTKVSSGATTTDAVSEALEAAGEVRPIHSK